MTKSDLETSKACSKCGSHDEVRLLGATRDWIVYICKACDQKFEDEWVHPLPFPRRFLQLVFGTTDDQI